ncbi:hypothetical protein H8M03_03405 [Sphingomonas sabuli]|uniref:Uncharacterized protein n=1 Tax=Sphingomonas sabuli TaxID=2764186 RepID=A0A7G9L452_9SPHN|nr:hypothetical protein [Sphingomonas sabuli]QNM83401.1 hypothetical protein H8M03_03405 [Sphingomonas sabuli]
MNNNYTGARRIWKKPMIRTIAAGSAEAIAKTVVSDGGSNNNGKNFS